MRTEWISRRLGRRTAVVPCLAAIFLLTAVPGSAADRVVESRTKTARLAPKDFGTDTYGVTKISAMSFYPAPVRTVTRRRGAWGGWGVGWGGGMAVGRWR